MNGGCPRCGNLFAVVQKRLEAEAREFHLVQKERQVADEVFVESIMCDEDRQQGPERGTVGREPRDIGRPNDGAPIVQSVRRRRDNGNADSGRVRF